jgi:LacI family transcriptional regulator
MPGIVEVAKRAGVSITTASRVLNHVDYPVAAATRRRVEEAARDLRYSPSALARALVTRRSGIVGVLVGDMVDPYFAEIARGVEDAARRAGYLVVLCNTDRDPATERRYVATLADYRVDALIFVGGDIVAPGERRKLKQQLALATRRGMLAVACAGEHAGLPTIDIDHRAAAREMAAYLVKLGQ